MGGAKQEGYICAAQTNIPRLISKLEKGSKEGISHLIVWKSDGYFHGQIRWFCKNSHGKHCKPPMSPTNTGKRFSKSIKFNRKIKNFFIRDAMKKMIGKLIRRQKAVRTVNTNFSSCINAILSLPPLDEPCFAPIMKINRFTVKNKVKKGGVFVI